MSLHVNCHLLQEKTSLMKAERYIICGFRIKSLKITLNSMSIYQNDSGRFSARSYDFSMADF